MCYDICQVGTLFHTSNYTKEIIKIKDVIVVLVKELQGTSELPEEFIDTLLDVCPDCGADIDISESLRELTCTNPFCRGKIAKRMELMLRDMGVKNMGENRCLAFVDATHATTPMLVLAWEESDGEVGGLSVDFMRGIKEQIDNNRSMMLWEYIKFSNIPALRDTARELFKDYHSLETFYADMDEYAQKVSYGGVLFIQEKLKIKEDSDSLSLRALNIYSSLSEHRVGLFAGLEYVTIINPKSTLNVCISTSVGNGYSSKSDFVNKMNQRYGEVCHINFLSSITKNCEYLIWSKVGAETSKVKKAKAYGIPIMTGVEFEEMLRGYVV